MNLIQRLLLGSSWLTIANIVTKIISLITLPLLARLLGKENFGLYNLIFIFIQSANSVSSFGVEISLQTYGSQAWALDKKQIGNIFSVGIIIALLSSVTVAIVTFIFHESFAEYWLQEPSLSAPLQWIAIIIAIQPISVISPLFLLVIQKFSLYANYLVLSSISTNSILIFCVWKTNLQGLILGIFLGLISQIILLFIIVTTLVQSQNITLQHQQFFRWAKSLLKLGFPYYLGHTLLGSLLVPVLMGYVNKYGGLEELGYLRISQSFSTVMQFLPMAIAPVALSYLSSSKVENLKIHRQLKFNYLRVIILVATLSVTVFSFNLPWIIPILFGSQYSNSINYIWLNLWKSMLAIFSGVLIQYLLINKSTFNILVSSALGTASLGLSAMLLIPYQKGIGLILAQIIGELIGLSIIVKYGLLDLTKEQFWVIGKSFILVTFLLPITKIMATNHQINTAYVLTNILLILLIAAIIVYSLSLPSEKDKLISVIFNHH